MPKNEGFACTQCGACCRRIAKIAELAHFDDGNGICKNLDKSSNICKIYADRPEICRIDMMFERYFAKAIPKSSSMRSTQRHAMSCKKYWGFQKDSAWELM